MITFENISKIYGKDTLAVDNISFSVNSGEFITLIGPSGCGKTTVLKMINGLITSTAGKIFINGKDIKKWNPIQLRRNIGYVIQEVGLFPHMKIKDNITYVLKIKGQKNSYKRAEELCHLVGLKEDYLERYPRELSGGQKQRVGVARALATNPDLILMDEPFGAIDRITRSQLQDELKNLHQKLEKTIIFVTHDIQEALSLGQRVMVMNKGKIEQLSTPLDLLINPTNIFIQEFLGVNNFYHLLSILKVKDVMKSEDYINKSNNGKISADNSLGNALEKMFLAGKNDMLVEENQQIIGRISFNEAYKYLKKRSSL